MSRLAPTPALARGGDLGGATETRDPQDLFEDETLVQAPRQLTMYGYSGLLVLSADRRHLRGWLTRHEVLTALAETVATADQHTGRGRGRGHRR